MKPLVLMFALLFVLVSATFLCSAYDVFEEQISSSGADELFDYLDDEQLDLLKTLGIEEMDFESAFAASPRKIFDLFYKIIVQEYISPFKACTSVLLLLVCSAVANIFITSSKYKNIVDIFSSLIITLSFVMPLTESITRAVSTVSLAADFMRALIPVLALVLTVSGNPSVAFSYNSLCFMAAQAVTAVMNNFIRPLIKITMAISLMSGVSNMLNLDKIVSFIRKTVMFLMSLLSTVFITMLSIKGMLASSADTVAVRGVRFLVGNIIPVVGGAVSDAYTSVIGTLSLVKNTVAVVGIASISIIVLPVIIECVCWIFALNMTAAFADVLSLEKQSSLVRATSSTVVLLTVTVVFVAVVFVLSIGLIMVMKGG